MDSSYTWILIVGIVVFFAVIVVLLCFTKAAGERLFFSGIEDPELANEIEETPALLALLSEDARISYEQAKVFQQRHPPDSIPTDITLSQYVSIQEKGVSAFEFEGDLECNAFVSARTEIQFFSGECCVQTNLPLPRNQEVYYWEAKMFEKPPTTMVAIGVATKPYPQFRLPGWNRHSLAYFSDTGEKRFNNPFFGKEYGPSFEEGDVIGVGYRHRTGTIFFTRNGRKFEDACSGLRWNLFPTIGANGPCQIHVNLGQMGFVFVEANVKKWGLAPMQGTLAPPPAYGLEAGSLLLERGMACSSQSSTPVHQPTAANIDDNDDEQPLIQIDTHIPIPNTRLRYPQYSPPAYSTFPRSPGMFPDRSRLRNGRPGCNRSDSNATSSSSSDSSSSDVNERTSLL